MLSGIQFLLELDRGYEAQDWCYQHDLKHEKKGR